MKPGHPVARTARVTLQAFDSADHFLIFSHRTELLPVLEEWFRAGR